MKLWISGFCVLAAVAALVRADEPATRPTYPADTRTYDRPMDVGGGGRFRMGGGGFRRFGEMPTDAEWTDISAFMTKNSPERLKVINSLPEGQRRDNLKILASREYRNVQRTRMDQPALAEIMTKRIDLEDQVFKLVNDVKADKTDKTRETHLAGDKQTLQQKVGELLDMNIKERQARVAKLKETLAEEEGHLADDTKNRDQLVKNHLKTFLEGQRQDNPRADASPMDPRDTGDRQTPTTQP